jgi:hypothetical protein
MIHHPMVTMVMKLDKLLDKMTDKGIEWRDYLFTSQDLTILMSFLLLSVLPK